MDRIRELEHNRRLTKAFGYTTRGNLRQRVPKGLRHTIQTDSLTPKQIDALVDLRLKHTFNPRLARDFIQRLPEKLRSKFRRRVIGCHSFWQEAVKFLIQNEELAELQDGKLILKLELPDGTKVVLDNAYKRMVEKEARRQQKLGKQFIWLLGQYFRQIAEERGYTVHEYKD